VQPRHVRRLKTEAYEVTYLTNTRARPRRK
jgi:hypothetical protein